MEKLWIDLEHKKAARNEIIPADSVNPKYDEINNETRGWAII